MKNSKLIGIVLLAIPIFGCGTDTSRPPESADEALKAANDPAAKAREQKVLENAQIEAKIRGTHTLPNGQPIPGYHPAKGG